jgi:SAM-dependent methyltransferase
MDPQYAEQYATLYRQHWWWRARERLIVQEVGRLLHPDGSARILDVGCGAGLLFDALAPFGRIEGVEHDAVTAAQGGLNRGRIWVGQFDDTYQPEHRFDLVIMADVLEHLENPGAALRKAASLLAQNGRILITVPAFRWLWTLHDRMNQHRTRYSASELSALVMDAGLAIHRLRYFFGWLILPKLLVRLREIVIREEPKVPRVPAPWINELLTRVSVLESRWLADRLPCGSSLLVICARPMASARG